jgi:leader peptidase (prepilin peptidase) / N-methyltransferase
MLHTVPPELLPLAGITFAALGACIGSFLNVVAWRLPRQESLIRPGSHCPHCGSRLRWFENIPLLSWVLQRGRCRHEGAALPLRYPAVEALTAGLFVAASMAVPSGLGVAPPLLVLMGGWLLVGLLLPLLLIDLDHLWLPEPLCRWGVVLGLAISTIAGCSQGEAMGRALLLWHLLAASAGLLGFEAVSAAAARVLGKPALGLGDAKLAALLGAWLGLTGLGLMVSLAVLSGALFGVLGRISGRLQPQQPFPFGPFLAAAGVAVWIGGNDLWQRLLWPALG